MARRQKSKKADVAEHPEVFHHVGLLANEPSGEPDCSLYSHPTTFIPLFSRAALVFIAPRADDQILPRWSAKKQGMFHLEQAE
jgi:hypothetical protein